MIDGLGGVLISTSAAGFERMRSFYLELLAIPPRSDRSGFVNFELGSQRLTIAVHSEISHPNADPLHVMINLITNDVVAAHRHAIDVGAGDVRSPARESWGGWIATLTDPDGNIVQLLQLPRE